MKNENKGIAAIMLVIWMSLGLLSLAISLSQGYSLLMRQLIEEGHMHRARSAAMACKAGLIVRLMEEPRRRASGIVSPVPDIHGGKLYLSRLPDGMKCGVDSFSSIECRGSACCEGYQDKIGASCKATTYGEIKEAHVTGIDQKSGKQFHLSLKLLFANDPPYIPFVLRSKAVDE